MHVDSYVNLILPYCVIEHDKLSREIGPPVFPPQAATVHGNGLLASEGRDAAKRKHKKIIGRKVKNIGNKISDTISRNKQKSRMNGRSKANKKQKNNRKVKTRGETQNQKTKMSKQDKKQSKKSNHHKKHKSKNQAQRQRNSSSTGR